MKVETYKCDVCGKFKELVNHWWVAWIAKGTLTVEPWDDKKSTQWQHLCGSECVIKKVNEFLVKGQTK